MKTIGVTILFALSALAQGPAKNPPGTTQKTPAAAVPKGPAREPGLYATIKTSMGDIVVKLYEKQSPLAVKNFTGLAMGTKTWTDPKTNQPTKRPLYTGTTFHRVIPGFMIQGGDPIGTGMGTPGYTFKNEDSPDLKFDGPGRLAMANAGRDTNGAQFFITVAPYPSLNGGYTIFGQVIEGQEVADNISKVPRDPKDKPLAPVKIVRIAVTRVRAPAPAGAPTKKAVPKAAPKKAA